jgi:hypothetical protein
LDAAVVVSRPWSSRTRLNSKGRNQLRAARDRECNPAVIPFRIDEAIDAAGRVSYDAGRFASGAWMGTAIAVGAAAPEFQYAGEAGRQAQLSEHWSSQPALVLWLRHFG